MEVGNRYKIYINGRPTSGSLVPEGRSVVAVSVATVDIDGMSSASSSDAGSFCRGNSIRCGDEEEEEAEENVTVGQRSILNGGVGIGVGNNRSDHRRDSPSHRSQDSGFSDSGESNCGGGQSSLTTSVNVGQGMGQKRPNGTGRPGVAASGPASLGVFRRKASRVFYANDDGLGNHSEWTQRQSQHQGFIMSKIPEKSSNVWSLPSSNSAPNTTNKEATLWQRSPNSLNASNGELNHYHHQTVVRFGKTKSVPSLDEAVSASQQSTPIQNSPFSLSAVGANIRRTLFGSKSSQDLAVPRHRSTPSLPPASKTASPVQKGILKKQQKDNSSGCLRATFSDQQQPWLIKQPNGSFNKCWSTAVLAKEIPTWNVASLPLATPLPDLPAPKKAINGYSTWNSANPSSLPPSTPKTPENKNKTVFSSATLPASSTRQHKQIKQQLSAPEDHPVLANSGSSVKWWWTDLRRNGGEPECTNVLQGKSLLSDKRMAPAISSSHASSAIKIIQRRAHVISGEFVKLCQQLENHMFYRIPPISQNLVVSIEEFLAEFRELEATAQHHMPRQSDANGDDDVNSHSGGTLNGRTSTSPPPSGSLRRRLKSQENSVRKICSQLRKSSSSSPQAEDFKEIVQMVASLGHAFTRLVNIMLTGQIERLLVCLEMASENFTSSGPGKPFSPFSPSSTLPVRDREPPSFGSSEPFEIGAIIALKSLIAVGLGGFGNGGVGGLSALVAAAGGIRTLLSLCLLPSPPAPRALALRALAALCCVPQAIRQLDEAGGIEVLADILCESEAVSDDNFGRSHIDGAKTDRLEKERTEAAGVLAQVTSPWIEENHHLGGLQEHLRRIVTALTELCCNGGEEERFLLASASLANLSFLAPEAIEIMRDISAAQVLISAARTHKIVVFAKDQIATVLANMAASPMCRGTVASEDGLHVLHDFLLTSPHPDHRPAEISACERVQQKSAIALSRLCSEPEVARKVVDLKIVERLVFLCRDDKERNQSDAVLIGCLAALRKIVAACGLDPLRKCNASDLVEPRLLDSFLLCSSQQESYV